MLLYTTNLSVLQESKFGQGELVPLFFCPFHSESKNSSGEDRMDKSIGSITLPIDIRSDRPGQVGGDKNKCEKIW